MSALWHGNKAEELGGGTAKAELAPIWVFFSAEPNDFHLGFPTFWAAVALKRIKCPKLKADETIIKPKKHLAVGRDGVGTGDV